MIQRERWHIIFIGCVQSVGFRYRSKYAADALGLCGWVKNLWDGSVEMEVQGTEEEIRRMLSAVQSSRYIRVDQMNVDKIPLQADGGFHVR